MMDQLAYNTLPLAQKRQVNAIARQHFANDISDMHRAAVIRKALQRAQKIVHTARELGLTVGTVEAQHLPKGRNSTRLVKYIVDLIE